MYGIVTLYDQAFQPNYPQCAAGNAPLDYNSNGEARQNDFQVELLPLHSQLLGESLLVSFPPLINMLKSSGSSYLISGPIVRLSQTDTAPVIAHGATTPCEGIGGGCGTRPRTRHTDVLVAEGRTTHCPSHERHTQLETIYAWGLVQLSEEPPTTPGNLGPLSSPCTASVLHSTHHRAPSS